MPRHKNKWQFTILKDISYGDLKKKTCENCTQVACTTGKHTTN